MMMRKMSGKKGSYNERVRPRYVACNQKTKDEDEEKLGKRDEIL
jgi:hypothetical protein